MVAQISVPNYHEDQPSALETGLTNSIAAHNPLGAAYMLMAEQNRRGDAQNDYHNYMAGINALQQQNLSLGHEENRAKIAEGIANVKNAGGAGFVLQQFPGMFPGADVSQIDSGLAALRNSEINKNYGQAVQGYGSGGVTPPGISSLLPPGPDGQPIPVGETSLVQGQRIAAQGRVDASSAGGANKGYVEKIEPAVPGSPIAIGGQIKTHVPYGGGGGGGGRVGANNGVGSLVRPASSVARTDDPRDANVLLGGIEGDPGSPASTPAPASVATTKLSPEASLSKLLTLAPPEAAADIKASMAANKGQLPTAQLPDGRTVALGMPNASGGRKKYVLPQ